MSDNGMHVHGIFWRKLLAFGIEIVPYFLEPVIMSFWSLVFYLGWGEGRRGVTANLRVIAAARSWPVRAVMALRVFYNFGYTFMETMQFSVRRTEFDWELVGTESFAQLSHSEGGAIVLTAHMGNYDLGSYFFARESARTIMIVRAPEQDPESERDSRQRREEFGEETGKLAFGEPSAELAVDLVSAIREGKLVAIQGDRAIAGVASMKVRMFDRDVFLPSGPFALALATRSPIFPLFIVRAGPRSYRVISEAPIVCKRTGRDRERDIAMAMQEWAGLLERTIGRYSTQWYNFDRFFEPA